MVYFVCYWSVIIIVSHKNLPKNIQYVLSEMKKPTFPYDGDPYEHSYGNEFPYEYIEPYMTRRNLCRIIFKYYHKDI